MRFSQSCESSLAFELLEHQALGSCAGGSTAISMRLFLALGFSHVRGQSVEPLSLPLSSEGSSLEFLFFPFSLTFFFSFVLFFSFAFALRWFVFLSWHAAWLHVFAREGAVFMGVAISFAAVFHGWHK